MPNWKWIALTSRRLMITLSCALSACGGGGDSTGPVNATSTAVGQVVSPSYATITSTANSTAPQDSSTATTQTTVTTSTPSSTVPTSSNVVTASNVNTASTSNTVANNTTQSSTSNTPTPPKTTTSKPVASPAAVTPAAVNYSGPDLPGNPAQRQTAKTYRFGSTSRQYLEYLPADYNRSNKTYPLLIFFHGSGEAASQSGGNVYAVKNFGPPMLIDQGHDMCFAVNGTQQCFIVVSPQSWDWSTNAEGVGMLEWAMSHYRVDTNRIYVTGLSMGGGLAWTMASAKTSSGQTVARQLAALAPIAGLTSPETLGCNIAYEQLPVWAFHGQNDNVVSPDYSKRIVGLLNGNPINSADRPCSPNASPDARLTLLGGNGQFVDHYLSWTIAYDPHTQVEAGKNLYQWLLSQHR